MAQDDELEVMGAVYNEFMRVDDEAKQRVLDWIAGKFSLISSKNAITGTKPLAGETITIESFDSVADAFTTASPEIDRDKALIVAAFLQRKMGKGEITGYEINQELRQLGHGLRNVTDAMSQMMEKKPKLMIQVKKEGKSKQARKKYKVTSEGFKAVQEMLTTSQE